MSHENDRTHLYSRQLYIRVPASLGLDPFLGENVPESLWRTSLCQALESDEIRVLSHRSIDDKSVQFSLSTKPAHSPAFLIQRLKGRLQYAVRDHVPKALRPHYSIRSFGTQDRAVMEAYVANQTSKHRMAAERAQMLFEDLLFVDHRIDLSSMQKTSHGDYWFNLHVVIVNEGRWCDVRRERLEKTQRVILKWSMKKGLRLSRCAILADHMHMAVGCPMELSPEAIVLSLMNTVAWVYKMSVSPRTVLSTPVVFNRIAAPASTGPALVLRFADRFLPIHSPAWLYHLRASSFWSSCQWDMPRKNQSKLSPSVRN